MLIVSESCPNCSLELNGAHLRYCDNCGQKLKSYDLTVSEMIGEVFTFGLNFNKRLLRSLYHLLFFPHSYINDFVYCRRKLTSSPVRVLLFLGTLNFAIINFTSADSVFKQAGAFLENLSKSINTKSFIKGSEINNYNYIKNTKDDLLHTDKYFDLNLIIQFLENDKSTQFLILFSLVLILLYIPFLAFQIMGYADEFSFGYYCAIALIMTNFIFLASIVYFIILNNLADEYVTMLSIIFCMLFLIYLIRLFYFIGGKSISFGFVLGIFSFLNFFLSFIFIIFMIFLWVNNLLI